MSGAGWTRADLLLGLGASIGLLAALVGLATPTGGQRGEVPPGAVATVDGHPIARADYDRALTAYLSDVGPGASPDRARERVLERLIDEELLVRRGLEVGMAERDPRIRSRLVASTIRLLTLEAEEEASLASEAELRAFYGDNRAFFGAEGRVEVRRYTFDTGRPRASARAAEVKRALESGHDVDASLVDGSPAPVPTSPLPPSRLRRYVGAPLANAAGSLDPGEVSEPVEVPGGLALIQVLSRQAGAAPPFEEIVDRVAEEHRRRAGEHALRAFLDGRRRQVEVVIDEELR